MAFNPNVVVVAPGELITAAHLNNIRSNLDRLDITKALLTGQNNFIGQNFFAASAVAGNPGLDRTGIWLSQDGPIYSRVSTSGGINTTLTRDGAGDVVGCKFVQFTRFGSTLIGSITMATGANSVAYNTTSDRRLKDDVGPITDALDRVAGLHPRRLAWKSDGSEFEGFFADEIAAVVPSAVTGEPDAVTETGDIDPQQLDRSALIPLLVAAVQDLTGKVAELQARLEATL